METPRDTRASALAHAMTTLRRGATLMLSALLVSACVSGRNSYTPVASPEAPTACPRERRAAHDARDLWMQYATIANREAAAEAVFTLARCEAVAADGVAPRTREQYDNALILLREVRRYDVELWTILSLAETAALRTRFAEELRRSGGEEIAVAFEQRALRSYAAVLRAVARRPSFPTRYPSAGPWLARACAAMDAGPNHPACR